ncbi:sigma-70 family RNA polymerase sigma factor [Rhodospirillaceae bacterium SYSU D60014]|uniref:sigma-70 family RNA polymerase sigma factor n=1 Tax=Virgifigura deserti TaxID=2268457 RepID=UPI000E675E7A
MARDEAASEKPSMDERLDWSTLMARAQDGDRDAYRRLLGDVTPYLRSLVARHHRNPCDVEDVVQDILLTVHAIRRTYDPKRPFGPWLAAIAKRRIIDRLRKQGRSRLRESALEEGHETFAAPDANLHAAAAWDERALRAAVASLPAGQRQAVTLLKLREMSLKEASAASGMSVASLKVATHRALKSLRRILGQRRNDR